VTVSGEASDNYRARYYSPELQRFISEDPIGLAGGINEYSYAHNGPVNFVDPIGLYSWTEFGYDAANAAVGFGDGVSKVLTFGLYSTADARKSLGIEGGVNQCSSAYSGGKYVGYAWGMATMWAAGLNGGDNSVFWAGRGASTVADTLGTTITKTPIGALLNGLGVENRLVWGAASATFAANASGTAQAVIRYVDPDTLWLIEQAILNWRSIPIVFH
jgi:uncharacterized protein RhaS with RHS repeats